ncbi:MAG: site-specific integrase [Muribaculaceae bacterium]|nr:site-specific integrase [Muribaculaceae bacterium]MDE6754337.1 site-specific integrase [Muribaculaceae bacterium]
MTSIKVKFRINRRFPNKGTIFFQMSHDRSLRQVNTGYSIFTSEWDPKREILIPPLENERKGYVNEIKRLVRYDILRFNRIILHLKNTRETFGIEDIVSEYRRLTEKYSIFHYFNYLIQNFIRKGKIRTAETYTSTLNSFKAFRCGIDMNFDCLTSEIIESYESWLLERGLNPNSTSFYMRIIRAAYNRAVDESGMADVKPFKHVYTGIAKTIKRAVNLNDIRRIKKLNLPDASTLDYARDIFIMSFYLRGMSLVDMAFLRKSDLQNGFIVYKRRKTGRRLIIQWTKEMGDILCKYPDSDKNCYLLPILSGKRTDEYSEYRREGNKINKNLKRIGKMLNVEIPLTLYVARHSWASAARSEGIPLSIISEGMGHNSETTTQIYLASLDNSRVDNANSKLMNRLA